MFNLGMKLVKQLARTLLGNYSAYYVYSSPDDGDTPSLGPISKLNFSVRMIDDDTLQSSAEPLICEQAHYLGSESYAYACFLDNCVVGLCIYWFGERYKMRNFWPLNEGEAKLVQIVSVPKMRGRGVATVLIMSSCRDIIQKGFRRAYARIWHSNTPSLRAFERGGWTRVALVLEINPLRRQQPTRIVFRCRRGGE